MPGKVFARILIERIQEVTISKNWEVQCAVLRECIDIFLSSAGYCQLSECEKPYYTFVDLGKLCDTENRPGL